MATVYEFLFLLFSHLTLLLLAAGDHGNGYQAECPPSFDCGYLGNISFPFTKTERQDCGLLAIHNCDETTWPKRIQLQNKGKWFDVMRLHQSQFSRSLTSTTIFQIDIRDNDLYKLLQSRSCEAFSHNYTLPPSFHFVSFRIEANATLFRCNRTLHVSPPAYIYNYTGCHDYDLYYKPSIPDKYPSSLTACTTVQLPIKDVPDAIDPFTFVTAHIFTEAQLSDECADCHYQKRGRCQLDSKEKFYCAKSYGKPYCVIRKFQGVFRNHFAIQLAYQVVQVVVIL